MSSFNPPFMPLQQLYSYFPYVALVCMFVCVWIERRRKNIKTSKTSEICYSIREKSVWDHKKFKSNYYYYFWPTIEVDDVRNKKKMFVFLFKISMSVPTWQWVSQSVAQCDLHWWRKFGLNIDNVEANSKKHNDSRHCLWMFIQIYLSIVFL